jgi:hypothetical protein
MLRVLSKEESFSMMRRAFAALRAHDVIDLCFEDERFPAIVVSIDKIAKKFEVVRLDKEGVRALLHGRVPCPVRVVLPPAPGEHPMWNLVGR